MFRYTPPPPELFIRNRANFSRRMQPGTLAVFFATQPINTNADGAYTFEQDSNFYYLSGIDQEDCLLLLCPEAPQENLREVLFVKPTSEHIQIWEGWKYSPEEAAAASGIRHIRYLHEFDSVLQALISTVDAVYLDINEHSRNSAHTLTPAHRFAERLHREHPAHGLRRAAPILAQLRMQKQPEEAEQIRHACAITGKAFQRVLAFAAPGLMEYEVEAEIRREFIRHGGRGPAYEPIVAGGANACVLHYTRNCQPLPEDQLLLMDFGTDYGNYSSDLTRTIPISGRFTARQRSVYEAVRRVQRAAIERLAPGLDFQDYNRRVAEDMEQELLHLGLISEEDIRNQDPARPAYKRYFPHGVSHHMGLDTHDVGSFHITLQPGMVFTVEPGIYIREEGIGIRLENDVLITEDGHEDLMAHIPIEPDEIEEAMRLAHANRA